MQAQDPLIVFLTETWSTAEHMRWIENKINFDGRFTMPSNERGGGLALLWRARANVWVDSFSKYHIDSINIGGTESAWKLTGFYGDTGKWDEGWHMLHMLRRSLNCHRVALEILMNY